MPQENVNLVIRGKTLIDGTGAEPVPSGLVAVAGKKIVYARLLIFLKKLRSAGKTVGRLH